MFKFLKNLVKSKEIDVEIDSEKVNLEWLSSITTSFDSLSEYEKRFIDDITFIFNDEKIILFNNLLRQHDLAITNSSITNSSKHDRISIVRHLSNIHDTSTKNIMTYYIKESIDKEKVSKIKHKFFIFGGSNHYRDILTIYDVEIFDKVKQIVFKYYEDIDSKFHDQRQKILDITV
jgi:hypothetical protein